MVVMSISEMTHKGRYRMNVRPLAMAEGKISAWSVSGGNTHNDNFEVFFIDGVADRFTDQVEAGKVINNGVINIMESSDSGGERHHQGIEEFNNSCDFGKSN